MIGEISHGLEIGAGLEDFVYFRYHVIIIEDAVVISPGEPVIFFESVEVLRVPFPVGPVISHKVDDEQGAGRIGEGLEVAYYISIIDFRLEVCPRIVIEPDLVIGLRGDDGSGRIVEGIFFLIADPYRPETGGLGAFDEGRRFFQGNFIVLILCGEGLA